MDMQSPSLMPTSTANLLEGLVALEGTAGHDYCVSSIVRSPNGFVRNNTDFADTVHHLSLLHGHVPGVIDHAATRIADNAARGWLLKAVDGFSRERLYLNTIVVAAGPLPSTAGQDQVTTIVAQQCRALDMLAQSDRRGCAIGAAMALVMDWVAIRKLLDGGAARLGIDPRESQLPDWTETLDVLTALEVEHNIGRAVQFGAGQLLGQHRGVWDLLQARAQVRRAALG
ncbi:MAG TPA: hypothetical protein VF503_18090 [Sphingobium sp.]|uniref:DUF6975 family protein n=1 Tax=Sphingobium sp. TaxID=1912891 RepID=UPI002ED45220